MNKKHKITKTIILKELIRWEDTIQFDDPKLYAEYLYIRNNSKYWEFKYIVQDIYDIFKDKVYYNEQEMYDNIWYQIENFVDNYDYLEGGGIK